MDSGMYPVDKRLICSLNSILKWAEQLSGMSLQRILNLYCRASRLESVSISNWVRTSRFRQTSAIRGPPLGTEHSVYFWAFNGLDWSGRQSFYFYESNYR